MVASRRVLQLLSVLIALSIFCTAGFARPRGRAALRSRASRGRTSAISRARGATRFRGRLHARGRHARLRLIRRVARVRQPHYSGIHNFLAGAWSLDQPEANTEHGTNNAPGAAQCLATSESLKSNSDTARSEVASASGSEPAQPVNPLVAAFVTSLADHGFSPDNQGFIVETLSGEVLAEHNADRLFNPASVVKVATSLVAISRLGPNFRFRTRVYTDGSLDTATGVLHGSLYVIGSGDPALFSENAMLIADQLNRQGIRLVEGNLVVQGPFYFNFLDLREAAARAFRNVLAHHSWGVAERRAYERFLAMRAAEDERLKFENASLDGVGDTRPRSVASAGFDPSPGVLIDQPVGPPSVKISGTTVTDTWADTSNLKLIAVHNSLPLVRLLKGLNDFSNNWMAMIIGRLVGGPDAVKRFLENEVKLKGDEVKIVTASGLGTNLISPRNMAQILHKLIAYLQKERLGIEDLLPVAGIDSGTLEKRFTDAFRGSVVAKTGTLRGVSALAGVANTRGRGQLLFVIFNRGGSPHAFRAVQDETIKKLIILNGGPAPIRYASPLWPRMSGAEVQSQNQR
jgi:D-alanyl-D-alanine carboxypeptidase/D-alanyl-D-alanine-endopeptidase (penicillin-binding protein 4)